MSADPHDEPWDVWAQREMERLETELAEARALLAEVLTVWIVDIDDEAANMVQDKIPLFLARTEATR